MSEPTQQPVEISKELKELVIARLNLIPNDVTVSVGADRELTRKELIERVRQEDAVGQEVVRSQLEFLKALSSGKLLEDLNLELSQ